MLKGHFNTVHVKHRPKQRSFKCLSCLTINNSTELRTSVSIRILMIKRPYWPLGGVPDGDISLDGHHHRGPDAAVQGNLKTWTVQVSTTFTITAGNWHFHPWSQSSNSMATLSTFFGSKLPVFREELLHDHELVVLLFITRTALVVKKILQIAF